MEISCLVEKDFEQVVQFLNKTMPYDEFSVELLKEQTIKDPDYEAELVFIARRGERIKGFILGICRGESYGESYSGIKIFSVREGKMSQDIGISLLEKLEEEFIKRGVFHINVGHCPTKYIQPGIDPRYTTVVSILLKKGYQIKGSGKNMEVDLGSVELETEGEEKRLKKEGIIIKRPTEEDRQRYMRFLMKTSDESVGMLAYNNNPISAHIAIHGNKVVGFAVHSVTTDHYFGPISISPKMQGKGIGGVLLKRCLKDIKKTGEKKAVILSAGPVYFYWKTVRAKIPRLLLRMSKDLKNKKGILNG